MAMPVHVQHLLESYLHNMARPTLTSTAYLMSLQCHVYLLS